MREKNIYVYLSMCKKHQECNSVPISLTSVKWKSSDTEELSSFAIQHTFTVIEFYYTGLDHKYSSYTQSYTIKSLCLSICFLSFTMVTCVLTWLEIELTWCSFGLRSISVSEGFVKLYWQYIVGVLSYNCKSLEHTLDMKLSFS